MKKIRWFKCGSCQAEYEQIVKDDVKVIDCTCGAKAVRQIAAPRCFGNTTGKSPASNYRRTPVV
jgi:DNA-directed RNA polymerase subunit RPC12/RpoP